MLPPTTSKTSQWCLKPIGWASHLFAGVAAALALWGLTPPGFYMGPCFVSTVLWLMVGFVWGTRALVRLIVAKSHQQPIFALPGGWKSWGVAPLLFLATVLMFYLHIPFSVAFAVSRPAMERFAHQSMASQSSLSQQPHRLGLYSTEGFDIMPWGMRFYIYSGWDTDYGFAYSSQGTLPTEHGSNLSTDNYIPIAGNWYEWDHDEDW